MAKPASTLIGLVLIVVGIVGFFSPNLMGAHLGKVHNVVHLVSGAAALYIGLKGTLAQAKTFALVFGLVYAALGVCGYFLTNAGEDHMLYIQPARLMLGTMDHYIHMAVGALFLISALATKTSKSATA